jgi:hypothetical protein
MAMTNQFAAADGQMTPAGGSTQLDSNSNEIQVVKNRVGRDRDRLLPIPIPKIDRDPNPDQP